MLSTKYPEIHFASAAMNITPSTFSKDIILNWLTFSSFFFIHKALSIKSSIFFSWKKILKTTTTSKM